jgi:ABC-type spermidine/putrescine transport system permease subunit II
LDSPPFNAFLSPESGPKNRLDTSLFLSDVHVTPLSVQLRGYLQQSADPQGVAVASLLVIIALVLIFICDRIAGID